MTGNYRKYYGDYHNKDCANQSERSRFYPKRNVTFLNGFFGALVDPCASNNGAFTKVIGTLIYASGWILQPNAVCHAKKGQTAYGNYLINYI